MPFSQEELSEIVKDIRNDDNYFTNSESICNRCKFIQIDDKRFDDVAVDIATDRELQFSIIGRVVRRSSFLQPAGQFRPSGVFPTRQDELSSLLNSFLRVSLAPSRDVMDSRTARGDWKRYQSTLDQLIKSAMDQTEGTKYWSPYRKHRNTFMIRHSLFSPRDKTLEGEINNHDRIVGSGGGINFTSSQSGEVDSDLIGDHDNTDLPEQQEDVEKRVDELTRIVNWPANEDWHKVADRFDKTHYISPLAAFDDTYELLTPQSYDSKLLGAVVHARFTLSRFEIRGDLVFVCNITELQVLRPPLRGAGDRKKRMLTDLIMQKKKKKNRTA